MPISSIAASVAASALLGVAVFTQPSAQAALVYSNTADAGITNNGEILDVGGYQARLGEYFAPGSISVVLPFLIPLLPPDESFTTANLRMQLIDLNNDGGSLQNVDLYGLEVRSSPTVLASDFYTGVDPDPTDATLIQTSFLTPLSLKRTNNVAGPFIETDDQGDLALASYLNTVYDNSNNTGQYLFLRLSYHASPVPAGNSYYFMLTQDAGGLEEKPVLSYSSAVVPEPASALLAGVSGLGLFARRRRAVV